MYNICAIKIWQGRTLGCLDGDSWAKGAKKFWIVMRHKRHQNTPSEYRASLETYTLLLLLEEFLEMNIMLMWVGYGRYWGRVC